MVDNILNKEEELERARDMLGRSTSDRETPTSKYQTTKRGCIYCRRKNHQSSDCRNIPPHDRLSYLAKNNLCRNCGKPNHTAQDCRSPGCFRCGRKHHPSVCGLTQSSREDINSQGQGKQLNQGNDNGSNGSRWRQSRYGPEAQKKRPVNDATRQSLHRNRTANVSEITNEVESEGVMTEYVGRVSNNRRKATKTVLLTGVAKTRGPAGPREVRILFDTGSELSFIDSQLSEELQLPLIRKERLTINTFGTREAETNEYGVTEVHLEDETGRMHTVTLYVSPTIANNVKKAKLDEEDLRFIEERGIRIAENNDKEGDTPNILLGCDQLWNLVHGSKFKLPSGIHLISTKFGYMLSGKQYERKKQDDPPQVMFTAANEVEQWDNFWKMDSAGIDEYHGPEKTEKELVNERVLRKFNDTIVRKKDGYYVRLPWKEQHDPLPDNKSIALARLHGIYNRYKGDPKILEEYDKVFKDQLQKGILEEVPEEEVNVTTVTHYLPHKPVFTPSKTTTKMRIVFDASAHLAGKPSLNDVLHQGPLILPKLQGMMLRFRTGKIAITTDVEKAFLQVRLHKLDRDATRCLWLKDANKPPVAKNLVTYRFTRVTFGLNASPFLLSATIRFHLEKEQDAQLAKEINTNL